MEHLIESKQLILTQFQERVSSLLPLDHQEEHDLLRWLVARNFNVDKAELMLKNSLEWRKEWQIDTILRWDPPEVLVKYYPVGLIGHDKTGCPVWIIPYGGCDMRGLLMSVPRRDYIRYTVRTLEISLKDMQTMSKLKGCAITQQCCIFDLDLFNMKHITWKPAMDVVLQLVQIYEANYPELLKTAYVINAPKVFTTAYAIIKPFLNEATLKKIQIFGQQGWKEVLTQDIDEEELPVHWGGTKTDNDGDPKCPSKVCLGGEVPKEYHLTLTKNTLFRMTIDKKITLSLGKGEKKRLKYEVTKQNSQLRWEFQTEDFDIGFGVSFKIGKGEEEVLLPMQRVNSQLIVEEGCIACMETGTYVVTFDNTFSYVRAKKIVYQIYVQPPSPTKVSSIDEENTHL